MITLVDSGIANIASVHRACEHVGAKVQIARNPQAVASASALILPGVGSFADGMQALRQLGLEDAVKQAHRSGIPILGICLGMQLLARSSVEFGFHKGLDIFPGKVARLASYHPGERVPNIGWCDVTIPHPTRLFSDVASGAAFYFMHSYFVACDETRDISGSLAFGQSSLCVAFERDNLFGVQFHPEKSQDQGLQVLYNFAQVADEKR
jgi:glutamine amidotransferase